jgi:hypothetical protein
MLQAWQRKAALDVAKQFLPFQNTIRSTVRRLRPYEPDRANIDYAITNGLEQISMLRDSSISIAGARAVEIGSGWCPVVPLLYILAGAQSVLLTDVERLLDRPLLEKAVTFVREKAEVIGAGLGINPASIFRALDITGLEFPVALERLRLSYTVPYRIEQLPRNNIDIIFSRTVLEHIAPDDLCSMFAESRRALSARGVMIHTIDNSDHFEFADKSISRINFLRYSEAIWHLACLNRQNYQNRLRHSDYRKVFGAAGYEVVTERREIHEGARVAARTLPLASRFRSYSEEDLATLSSVFLVRPLS